MELTPDQEKQLLELWNDYLAKGKEIKVIELTKIIFNDPLLDGRSDEGKAVKRALIKNKLKVITTKREPAPKIILTAEQKEYIENNCENSTSLEITREIFKNPNLSAVSNEFRAVFFYLKTLGSIKTYDNTVKSDKYNIPRSIGRIVPKINLYCNLDLKEETLTEEEKKGIQSLLIYIASFRFVRTMEAFERPEDREMFESQFIDHTWKKPDLEAEEVNLYIDVCSGYVQELYIRRQLSAFDRMLQNITEDPDGKLSMSLAQTISTKNTELDTLMKRRNALINDLIGKRSDRKKLKTEENRSILKLVEAFKNEESRLRLIKMAEREKMLLKDAIEEFDSMPALIASIIGPSKQEILN